MVNTVSADSIHFPMSLEETTPKTLALLRENHLNESSVTGMTKTNKAGVFEREKSSENSIEREEMQKSQDKDLFNTNEERRY